MIIRPSTDYKTTGYQVAFQNLLWVIWICCERFEFAVSGLNLMWAIWIWCERFVICCEHLVLQFDVTVVGHRTLHCYTFTCVNRFSANFWAHVAGFRIGDHPNLKTILKQWEEWHFIVCCNQQYEVLFGAIPWSVKKGTELSETDDYFLPRASRLELSNNGNTPNMSSSSHSSCCSLTQSCRRRRLRDWEEHPILVWRRYEDECANDFPQVSHLSLTRGLGVSSM